MGIPTPSPPPPGADCAACEGIHWEAGSAPKFVKMTLADIRTCGASDVEAPNGVYVLEQLEGSPCTWEYQDSVYRIFWRCEQGDPTFWAEGQGAIVLWQFFRDQTDACELHGVNEHVVCFANIGGVRGTADVEIL